MLSNEPLTDDGAELIGRLARRRLDDAGRAPHLAQASAPPCSWPGWLPAR